MNKTGFGFLRLPRLEPTDEKSIDFPLPCTLVDRFLERMGRSFVQPGTAAAGGNPCKHSEAILPK